MLPLFDNIPHRRPPVVNYVIIAVNVLVFAAMIGQPVERQDAVFTAYGVVPARFVLPADGAWTRLVAMEWLRQAPTLVTSQFLHAGWLHVIFNLWALWIFGDNVEDRMGPVRFAAFYLLCGVLGGATQVALSRGDATPMVGASGAIAGVLGAYLFLYPKARLTVVLPVVVYPLFFKLPAVAYLVGWFGLQLAGGWVAMKGSPEAAGVAWWAHVGGFAAGVVLLPLGVVGRAKPQASAVGA